MISGRLAADILGRRDEGADDDQSGVVQHPGHLRHPAEMLGQAFRAEIQLAAQAEANVFALEHNADCPEVEQLPLQGIGDLDFAARGEPGQPEWLPSGRTAPRVPPA